MAREPGKVRDAVYGDPRYLPWRRAVLKRDRYRCTICGVDVSGKGAARTHHVRPIKAGGDPFDVANGQTLCIEHHEQAHRERAAGGGGANKAAFVIKGCTEDGTPRQPPADPAAWKKQRFG